MAASEVTNQLFDWPGKSAPDGSTVRHSAVLHMLDVAAVAERLIAPFQFEPALRGALVLLVALHDLGKISDSFRAMIESGQPQKFRHWQLTEALLFAHDERLARRIGGTWRQRQALYASVAGHHGQPSDLDLGGRPGLPTAARGLRAALTSSGSGLEPAAEAIEALCDLWPEASLSGLECGVDTTALSWWLPGLCTAADWIGSNTMWFPPEDTRPELAAYLACAQARAEEAVSAAGLAGSTVKQGRLFDFALRPLQAACAEILLPSGPTLAVIEDETGAGKTEAALLLAHRMIAAGKGRGLYFALPTMATSDAMFSRAEQVIGRMLTAPSLTLAHGRAGLSEGFRDLVVGRPRSEDAASCTQWLAESRRRALLADVGVGTIDQALLSVLPVRHQTLRHFGLSSKILIVDEVHEMGEPYIGRELERLLQMHRAAGGSAILLTATLPMALRGRLLATYGGDNPGPAYPALTLAGGEARVEFPPDRRPVKGAVRVTRVQHAEDAADLLAETVRRGAACVWVRNSVDDAIEAVAALRARGVAAQLLHARFALADRKRIEAEVLARVGRDGEGRAGFALVGTQVLEASLDLDFDVMVSDIAPIAALIQRAGRLWRHMDRRPAEARPVPAPVLHVLSPDPDMVRDDRWLQGTLGGGAHVYALGDVWRSARVLFACGRIEAPQGLRALIEAVHGEAAEDLPEPLLVADMRTEGEAAAARTLASHNLVDLAAGYRAGGRGDSDATYPTRLGAETRTLVLARMTNEGLQPWAGGSGTPDDWALSEVSANRRRLEPLSLPDQSQPELLAITQHWPDWKRADAILCPVAEDGEICEGLRYRADSGLLFESSNKRG
ncbi:CRISPR-associated helicase Cas3' [Cereibacter sphaeroides]|uniref:CRISPR-associated helicase Cas3' n=1 Tax=Cereibacter sphaeroides TaxID=1063 RepID=UPI001F2AF16C|nr:CRISPR-associated helicase Cas3' [Cereibacter sphaeroides]